MQTKKNRQTGRTLGAALLVCALSTPGWAHDGHSNGFPPDFPAAEDDRRQSLLPYRISAASLARFDRARYGALRALLTEAAGNQSLQGISDKLAFKAAVAGEFAPGEVRRLFGEMMALSDGRERARILAAEAAELTALQAEFLAAIETQETVPRAVKRRLHATRLMLDLVTAWQANPDDGVP